MSSRFGEYRIRNASCRTDIHGNKKKFSEKIPYMMIIIVNQTYKGINIAGLVLEQSRAVK